MSKTIEELERERKAWSTPDFNPNLEDTFKPYSFIKTMVKPPIQMPPLRQDIQQQMQPNQGMIQLPNGQFVTPAQYQQMLMQQR